MRNSTEAHVDATRRVLGSRALYLALVFSTGLTACQEGDKAVRQPLGAEAATMASSEASASASSGPSLPLAALGALDAGNQAYREKKLDLALSKYQEAAAAAPTHAAPWFGIYMAAAEMKNSALADSAMRRVKALSVDPAALDAHATVTSPGAGATELPAGHPARTPALPPGHPKTKP